MKKVFLLLVACSFIYPAFAQKMLQKAIHNYYRYDPLERSFSSFINNLLNDEALVNKTVVKRTDTTLFFFKGEYKGHNPFGFKAIRTEIRLAEMEIENTDSISHKDTILAYQLLGYTSNDSRGIQDVKNEFAKFDRKYGAEFSNKSTKDLMEGNLVQGATCNYFLAGSTISPLTVLWGNINKEESIFAITLRFIKIENQGMLPLLYEPGVTEPGQ